MRGYGGFQRRGTEVTGTCGDGLVRYLKAVGVDVVDVTAPDWQDKRRRFKKGDLDAQHAAHAAFCGRRTVKPRNRDGMVKFLRTQRSC